MILYSTLGIKLLLLLLGMEYHGESFGDGAE